MANNISLSELTRINHKRMKHSLKFQDDFYYEDRNLSGNKLNRNERKHLDYNSFMQYMKQKEDNIDIGFDYREQLFFRSLSPLIFQNNRYANILLRIDRTICFLIDYVKMIKKMRNYHFPKWYRKFN